MRDRPGPPREERRERENVAILVPFFGVMLLAPPILNLFAGMRLPFGVPLEVVYLFAVWLLVIMGAVLLSLGRMFRDSAPPAGRESAAPSPAGPPEGA